MNEAEALALNQNAEAWQQRIKAGLRAQSHVWETDNLSPGITVEELLGAEIRDAILDAVVP